MNGGRAKKAEKAMVKDGHPRIPASTLHEWKTKIHPERYAEHRRLALETQDAEAVEAMYGIRRRALNAADETVRRYEDNIVQLDPKDLTRSFKDLAIGAGIYQDKAQILQGKAPVIEHRISLADLEQLEREFLRANGLRLDPRTGEPVVDAEVVEELATEEGTD